jgi:hypothetical protein
MVKRMIGRLDPDAAHTQTKEIWTHPDIQLLAVSGIHALAPNFEVLAFVSLTSFLLTLRYWSYEVS